MDESEELVCSCKSTSDLRIPRSLQLKFSSVMFVGRKAGHFSANFLFVVALLVTYLNLKDVWCKTQRFNHQVDFQRDWCPENCKLTLETRSCADVSNLRQAPNLTEVCQTFLSDNFPSVKDCEKSCGKCGLRKMLAPCTTRSLEKRFAICKLKPSTGKCRGYFVSWYYDHASADCKKFVYGGCGGNANRFEEHLPCLVRCGLLGVLYPPSKSAGLLSHEEL